MKLRASLFCLCGLAVTVPSLAQPAPRIGFVYPAGGQISTTFEVIVGGQYLDEESQVIVSGEGITAKVLEHDKIPPAQVVDDYRDRLREVQGKLRELKRGDKLPADQVLPTIRRLLREADLTEKNLRLMAEYDRRRNDPKQQLNNQIGESVRVKITVAEAATPGIRHLRVQTPSGLSNPMRFVVGQLPEVREAEPPREFDLEHYRGGMDAVKQQQKLVTPPVNLPVTLNGRIMPGEVDEFTFKASKGQQVVLAMHARSLIPYLADAVPGWFQSIVSLHNEEGYEVAYSDGYRFDPDPVLFYKIPADGLYRIRVHDSIYRGRDDFVYRITVGELPFLTGISPLGATAGENIEITFQGGNLGTEFKQKYEAPQQAGIILLHSTVGGLRSNSIPFHIDTVPQEREREPNASLGSAQELKPPVIVNGRIEVPGDADFYRVKGRGNHEMIFEIFARRLGSPVDASLTVFDNDGNQIAFNDDHEDLASGLTTHHADSRISVKLPADGQAFVRVTDTQGQSGITNAYQLKVHVAEPSFSLRVTPSSLNARPGGSAKLTVHALRSGGFTGPITLKLKNAPAGFEVKNAVVPADKDLADIAIAVPSTGETEKPVTLMLEGTAEDGARTITADAVPAEDMMQAFIYRHLVPVDSLLVDVRTPPPPPVKPTP
ncbi:hypothetical protein [Prosthecobacter sp.]|uniref:COG1470 family protein n=1 Tax=Prosthecobacter sp. TaxID=1965333 RepID=UPI002ABB4A46|nr:hypothetical protein [Prosthecobacter sp.]MDZ4402509.1 hypothetical protein [Prosthecobacter sp.]